MTEFGTFDPRRVRPKPRDRGSAYAMVQHDKRHRSIESKYGFVGGAAQAPQLSRPTLAEDSLAHAATVAAKSASFEDFKNQLMDEAVKQLEARHYALEIDKALGAIVNVEQAALERRIVDLRSL